MNGHNGIRGGQKHTRKTEKVTMHLAVYPNGDVFQFFSSSASVQRWVVTRYCWSGTAQQ